MSRVALLFGPSAGGAGGVGPKGDPGESAYQTWLAEGNSGTKAQFLASLVGTKGDKGDRGEKGDPGARGTDGINGTPGTNGINGTNGTNGLGITGASLNAARQLKLTRTDGSILDAGEVVLPSVQTTYPPQTLTVGATQVSLTVPSGANRGKVTVTVGSARIGLGSAAGAPIYAVDSGVEGLQDAQLTNLRLIREGVTDATVFAEYWREG